MKVLNRYITRQTLKGIFVALIIIASIIMLVDFVEGSRNIGADEELNPGQVFALTALKTPLLIEQTIPFVVLFGVMGALYGMNRRSELIVMRASGQSAWRFLTPAIMLVFFLGCLWTVLINPLALEAMSKHDDMVTKYEDSNQTTNKEIWLREGTGYEQTIIYAPSFNMVGRTLNNAEFTIMRADSRGEQEFSHRFDAKTAQLLSTGYWELKGVLESQPDGQQHSYPVVSLPTTITPKQIQNSGIGDGLSPIWRLPQEITNLTRAGFSSAHQKLRFHKLLALPLTLIAMAVIAAGVSMRLTREGGTLKFMLSGAAIGFAVFFVENIIKAFGENGAISPILAVWLIPIFVLSCGMAYLSVLEDG